MYVEMPDGDPSPSGISSTTTAVGVPYAATSVNWATSAWSSSAVLASP